jgi:hypothetical protein
LRDILASLCIRNPKKLPAKIRKSPAKVTGCFKNDEKADIYENKGYTGQSCCP